MAQDLKEETLNLLQNIETADLLISLYASNDKLKLFFECKLKTPNQAIKISKTDLLNLLPENISRELIDQTILEQSAAFLEKGQDISRRRIAKGKEVVPGKDGKLVLLVKPYDNKHAKQEFIDPWYIKHFDLIEKGSIVARIYPIVEGKSGLDVFGQAIAAPIPIEPKVIIDQTLEIKPLPANNYKNIIAKESGYLVVQGQNMNISNQLNIGGDCDHQIGDLDFLGNINVKGNVLKDFALSAKGNIEIQGDVINGFLHSFAGDIKVKGYITGNQNENLISSGNITNQQIARFSRKFFPQIRCAGNFSGSTLDNISLEAEGSIDVSKEIKSSLVRTKTLINIPKGIIIGGEIFTVCGLEARILGTESGTNTIINITSDIESSAEYTALLEKLKSHESAENLLRLYLGPYAEDIKKVNLLKPDLKAKIQNMYNKLKELILSKEIIIKEKTQLLNKAKYNHVYRVNCLEKIYPGVIIQSSDAQFKIDSVIDGKKTIEYFPKEQRFEIFDLKALECAFLTNKSA